MKIQMKYIMHNRRYALATAFAAVALLGLEAFELDDQNLRQLIKFKLLLDVAMFFTLGAVPLIRARK